MKFWNRKIQLTIGSKEYTNDDFKGLNINFSVPFSNNEEPDISEISIYNLSRESRNNLKKGTPIILNAGYEDNVGNILTGKIENINIDTQRVDIITKINVSDGGNEWRSARIQKTYQAGTTADYIMRDLANYMGYEVVEINPNNNIKYKLGKSISGSIAAALKQLVKDTNSKMFIDKNKLYIRNQNKSHSTGPFLSSDHGLIGSPEKVEEEDSQDKKVIKYKVRCLLNHEITADSLVEIKSKSINGKYRVESGVHTDEFITEFIAIPI